jgi:hypothetical protein
MGNGQSLGMQWIGIKNLLLGVQPAAIHVEPLNRLELNASTLRRRRGVGRVRL